MADNHAHHAILVLGMHRSGTSAVTRVINLLGADLGGDLLPPAEDNALGFWEHRGIVKIHEELLDALGSSWHSVQPLPAGWLSTTAAITARGKLIDTLREFSNAPLWAVKDPRLCRLLPLWLLVLDDLNVRAHAVFVVRHPDEVGQSLLTRDGIPLAHTRLLWLQHLVEAEAASRDFSRVVISYDDLLRDWRGCVQRMGSELLLQWPVSISEARSSVEQFLNPGERHHKLGGKNDTPLPELAQQAFQSFIAKANGGEGWDRVRKVSEIYSVSAGIFLDEIGILEDRIRAAEEQWRLAAQRVLESEATLSGAKAEWGHTADLLRESEAKQQHATEQWHATVEMVQTTEASLKYAQEQWEHTAGLLRESEAKQQHATEQWHATVELFQATEASLKYAQEQWGITAETARTTNDQLGQTREQLTKSEESLRDMASERQLAVAQLGELEASHEVALARVRQLERRLRWVLCGGIVVVLLVAVTAFCFRAI
jgi:hypothetical protein